MITFCDANYINTAHINRAHETLKLEVKKFLLEKHHLDESTFNPDDPVSVAIFAEYHLDLYLLGF